jgi:hypothetical protein
MIHAVTVMAGGGRGTAGQENADGPVQKGHGQDGLMAFEKLVRDLRLGESEELEGPVNILIFISFHE